MAASHIIIALLVGSIITSLMIYSSVTVVGERI